MKKLLFCILLFPMFACGPADCSCPTAENLCALSCKEVYGGRLKPGCTMIAKPSEEKGLVCGCYTKCPTPAGMK